MTFRFTVYDSPELPGLYAWELCDGPDGSITESGVAPTISRCLTEIAAARLRIDRATHPDTRIHFEFDTPPDPAPIPQHHPPDSEPLPTQLNIPATAHIQDPSTIFYLRPSKSG